MGKFDRSSDRELFQKGYKMEEKVIVISSIEKFGEYLNNTANDKTIISVVVELAGDMKSEKGGEKNG